MSKLIEICDKKKHYFVSTDQIQYITKKCVIRENYYTHIVVKLVSGEELEFDFTTFWNEEREDSEEAQRLWEEYQNFINSDEYDDNNEELSDKAEELNSEYYEYMFGLCRNRCSKEFTSIYLQWNS